MMPQSGTLRLGAGKDGNKGGGAPAHFRLAIPEVKGLRFYQSSLRFSTG